MKLLIELDEEYIKVIDKIKFLVGGRTDRKLQLEIIKAIKNGKPLEQEPNSDIRLNSDKNELNRVKNELEPTTKNDNEQEDITWIIGNDNVQFAVRNMPIDMMQKICSIIGNTKNDLALIHTEGLDEEIRCTMCTNCMKSDRGCDGSCVVDKDMYKAVMDAIEKRIQPTTKNDLAVECINRAELLKAIDTLDKFGNDPNEGLIPLRTPALQDRYVPYVKYDDMVKCIKGMPSVTPIRPKGHWIGHREHCENLGVMPSGLGAYEWCSNCDCGIDVREWHRNNYNFCPNCGADMREVEK